MHFFSSIEYTHISIFDNLKYKAALYLGVKSSFIFFSYD